MLRTKGTSYRWQGRAEKPHTLALCPDQFGNSQPSLIAGERDTAPSP